VFRTRRAIGAGRNQHCQGTRPCFDGICLAHPQSTLNSPGNFLLSSAKLLHKPGRETCCRSALATRRVGQNSPERRVDMAGQPRPVNLRLRKGCEKSELLRRTKFTRCNHSVTQLKASASKPATPRVHRWVNGRQLSRGSYWRRAGVIVAALYGPFLLICRGTHPPKLSSDL